MVMNLTKAYSDAKKKKMWTAKRLLILYKKDLKVLQGPLQFLNWIVFSANGHFRFWVELCFLNTYSYLILMNITRFIFVQKDRMKINKVLGINFSYETWKHQNDLGIKIYSLLNLKSIRKKLLTLYKMIIILTWYVMILKNHHRMVW